MLFHKRLKDWSAKPFLACVLNSGDLAAREGSAGSRAMGKGTVNWGHQHLVFIREDWAPLVVVALCKYVNLHPGETLRVLPLSRYTSRSTLQYNNGAPYF